MTEHSRFGARFHPRTILIIVGALALALLSTTLISLSLGARSEAEEQSSADARVAQRVDEASPRLVAWLQRALETSYGISGDPGAVDREIAELNLAPDGVQAFERMRKSIESDAKSYLRDVGTGGTIDHVSVTATGATEISHSVDGTASALINVQITRHVAGDEIDWVELIPYELVLADSDARIRDVIAHDTEYQEGQAGKAERARMVELERLRMDELEQTRMELLSQQGQHHLRSGVSGIPSPLGSLRNSPASFHLPSE